MRLKDIKECNHKVEEPEKMELEEIQTDSQS